MNTVIGLLIAVVLVGAASKYLPRIRSWLDTRREAREAERDRTEQLLRDMFANAKPIETVDRDWDRSDREIHGLTASELSERDRRNQT